MNPQDQTPTTPTESPNINPVTPVAEQTSQDSQIPQAYEQPQAVAQPEPISQPQQMVGQPQPTFQPQSAEQPQPVTQPEVVAQANVTPTGTPGQYPVDPQVGEPNLAPADIPAGAVAKKPGLKMARTILIVVLVVAIIGLGAYLAVQWL